ncbi:hypothetical protein D9M69_639160 [compost metagenome]
MLPAVQLKHGYIIIPLIFSQLLYHGHTARQNFHQFSVKVIQTCSQPVKFRLEISAVSSFPEFSAVQHFPQGIRGKLLGGI